MENMEQIISDTILERPIGFKVGEEHLYLYPVTLGKQYLISPLMKQLDLNQNILSLNPHLEFFRVAKEKTQLCCRILSIYTLEGKACLNNAKVEKRVNFFGENVDIKDLALLLETVLSMSNYDALLKHFGIDIELKDLKRARDAQKQSSTLSFCGKSIYGTLVDNLASKYGWTLDYILWGISYDNIQLLLSDSVKTVYLSDEEKRNANIYDKNNTLDGNDPESWERIKQMDWYQRALKNGDIS